MKNYQMDPSKYYIEKILTQLADAYRRSKKDSGTNVIHRRTVIKPEKIYRQYRENDGDPAEIDALNEAAEACRQLGFADYEMKRFSNEIDRIYLEDMQIEKVESYLKVHCGYESKRDKMDTVRDIIHRYEGKSPAADCVCGELRAKLDQNRIPGQYGQTEEVLRALVFVENNKIPLYLREASQMIYGSSKYFEEKTSDSVCKRLRQYLKRPCAQDEMMNEILKEYNIYPERQKFCIKGDAALKICGKEIQISAFSDGIEFAANELSDIQEIHVGAEKFVTVENKTAYYRCRGKDAVFFYLGGYASRTQRDFLKHVRKDNPHLRFLHFGDIDAGGFYIHEHLCRMTGTAFVLWHMSVQELADPKYASCLQELTAQDRRRLKKLAEKDQYRETVKYMLEVNVKLEQEIVSYHVSCGGGTWADSMQ